MKNKKYWLVTSAVTLLPMVAGLILWDRLPEKLPTHFGFDGTADGWGGKGFAVFGIPLMMLALHGILFLGTRLDKQNRGHNAKVMNLTGLLFPAMSIFIGILIYTTSMQIKLNLGSILFPLLGLFFILIGNWMPKVKQNTTLGIKIKWTLYSEENWNKTHRFAGWCWVLGGIAFCVMGFLPGRMLLFLLPIQVGLLAAEPVVYPWRLSKKQKAAGTWTESEVSKKLKKHPVILAVSMILVAAILVGVGFLMFTGDIAYTCTGEALVIEADFHADTTIPYEKIDSIEYRDTAPTGSRTWGYASARLLMGQFENDEFGGYTRYTYVGTDAQVIVTCGEDVLILNAKTEDGTLELYEQLMEAVK